jgi:hypothetical protein
MLQQGAAPEAVIEGFLTSPEYMQAHAATQADYIQALYTDLLGRAATDAEVALWRNAWNGGQVDPVRGILTSAEADLRAVDHDYLVYLQRAASASERTAWLAAVQNSTYSLDQAAALFLTSPEFQARTGFQTG